MTVQRHVESLKLFDLSGTVSRLDNNVISAKGMSALGYGIVQNKTIEVSCHIPNENSFFDLLSSLA